jgi:hypothetical protein
MNTLSHSSVNRYLACGKEYHLYYIEKIRPVELSSQLIYGSAIDAACEDYIKERNPLRAKEIFKDKWKEVEHNGKTIDLQLSTEVKYLPTDFDYELLIQSDNEFILKDTSFENVRTLFESLSQKEERSEEDLTRLAYCNWISLYRKGTFLVNKFIEWVDANVEEVLSCQEIIELEDGDGNKVNGKADFVLRLKGIEGAVVIDLKTTTKYYDRKSVVESDQLALYKFSLRNKYEDMKKAGYVVLHKGIKKNREKICSVCGHDDTGTNVKTCTNKVNNKRCNGAFNYKIYPEAVIQYIVDEIPEEKMQEVLEKFNIVNTKITSGEFQENRESCIRYNGKVKCPYYNYCHNDKDMTGLVCTKKEIK